MMVWKSHSEVFIFKQQFLISWNVWKTVEAYPKKIILKSDIYVKTVLQKEKKKELELSASILAKSWKVRTEVFPKEGLQFIVT